MGKSDNDPDVTAAITLVREIVGWSNPDDTEHVEERLCALIKKLGNRIRLPFDAEYALEVLNIVSDRSNPEDSDAAYEQLKKMLEGCR